MRRASRTARFEQLALAAILALALTSSSQAAKAPINVNLHPVDPDDSDSSPPFPTLTTSLNTSATSFHVNRHQCVFDKARSYTNGQKPRIYSDDAGFSGPAVNSRQKAYILAICNDIVEPPLLQAPRARGVEHYEHLEFSLVDRALTGATIGGYDTWVNANNQNLAAKDMMDWYAENVRNAGCSGMRVGNNTVPLAPNGTLAQDTVNTRRFLWNGNPATLIGFGFTGALTGGSRTLLVGETVPPNRDGFLGTLRSYGANLTRIWAIEQWTALAICPGATPHAQGLTPFGGLWPDYNLSLSGFNPAYFARLREFTQLAADRGIVVQLTLFDKHGVVNETCAGGWATNPYNMLVNQTNPPFINGSDLNDCLCQPCAGLQFGEIDDSSGCTPTLPTCDTLDSVFLHPSIAPIHDAYIRRFAQEVGGAGNVLFEIINEMWWNEDWPGIGEAWQRDYAACLLNKELPVFTARDSFNDEEEDEGLSGKDPDAGLSEWAGQNAAVSIASDPETAISMGHVRGRGFATIMRGALQLDPATPWTELGVRANVSRKGNNMELGFSAGGNPTSSLVRVELGSPLILTACTRIAIVKRVGTGSPEELASTCIQIDDGAEIHFLLDVVGRKGNVRLNGAPIAPLTNVNLGASIPAGLTHAYFRGSKNQPGPYASTDGAIDNFEANVYYRNPAVSCPLP